MDTVTPQSQGKSVFDVLGGRKMTLAILAVLCATILAALKVITGEMWVELVKWVVTGVAAAIAFEDSQKVSDVEVEVPVDLTANVKPSTKKTK